MVHVCGQREVIRVSYESLYVFCGSFVFCVSCVSHAFGSVQAVEHVQPGFNSFFDWSFLGVLFKVLRPRDANKVDQPNFWCVFFAQSLSSFFVVMMNTPDPSKCDFYLTSSILVCMSYPMLK